VEQKKPYKSRPLEGHSPTKPKLNRGALQMNNLVGKTIAGVVYQDPWNNGITLTFTDGTEVRVRDTTQVGDMEVLIDGVEMESNWHKGEEE
jgi:hypothetical protein